MDFNAGLSIILMILVAWLLVQGHVIQVFVGGLCRIPDNCDAHAQSPGEVLPIARGARPRPAAAWRWKVAARHLAKASS